MTTTDRKANGLEELRGVAALFVVIHHVFNTIGLPQNYGTILFWNFFEQGHLGVDIFFVISGFVITLSNPKDGRSVRQILIYILRRAARIFPMYWVAFICFVPLYAWFAPEARGSFASSRIIGELLLLPSNSLMLLPIAWTLRFEIMFYLLFVLMLGSRKVGVVFWSILVAAICFSMATGAVHANAWVDQLLSPYVLEFVAGMVLCPFVWKFPLSRLASVIFASAGIISVLVVMLWELSESRGARPWNLMYAAAALPLVYGVIWLPATVNLSKFSIRSCLQTLGRFSYSIYLVHYPVEQIVVKIATKVTGHMPGIYVVSIVALGALGISIATGLAVGRFIEIPLLERCKAGISKLKFPSKLEPVSA